jgi:hypothetical protein
VPNDYARKKNAGGPEPDTAKLQTTECHPKNADKGQRTYGVSDRLRAVQVKEPAHTPAQSERAEREELSDVGRITLAAALRGKLAAHFRRILVGIKSGQEMTGVIR